MTNREEQQDLVVLAADKNIEFAVRGIISRNQSLQIREIEVTFLRHPRKDPGCLKDPLSYLQFYCESHRYALVLLDHEGSGAEEKKREAIETQIEALLNKNGWNDRAAAIVIEPELEAWVWSDSPHVEEKLGWANSSKKLRDWLRENTTFWPADQAKPVRPKEAVEKALREVRKPRSSAIYQDLAKTVSLTGCSDPAFAKLTGKLREWFGE
ncbi:MAG: hypothetical protein JXM70_01580 [Pirellulales bacterium]|nr:hypothetical protein [Pirellulales bacterium]